MVRGGGTAAVVAPSKNEGNSNEDGDDVDKEIKDTKYDLKSSSTGKRSSPSKVKSKLTKATVLPSQVDDYFRNRVDPKVSLVEPDLLGTYTRYRKQLLPLSAHYHHNLIGVSSDDNSLLSGGSVYASSTSTTHPMNSENAKLVSQSLGPGVFVTAKDAKEM